MRNTQKKKYVVIVHDAGAAEIIAAHLVHKRNTLDIHAFIAGPAMRVFRREGIPYKKVSGEKKRITALLHKHTNADLVLLGTGWMTSIEFDALQIAKELGMRHAVYLDSWINYRERFGYPKSQWRNNLPDEIWIGDREAFSIAQKYFPKTRLRYMPNRYFKKIVARYKVEKNKRTARPDTILFLSDATVESDDALRKILDHLSISPKIMKLVIRLHPSDPKNRYQALLATCKTKNHITISKENDIVRNFIAARLVIGTETVALVAAFLVGIRTVSLIPKGKHSQLPFAQILKVRQVEDILDLI